MSNPKSNEKPGILVTFASVAGLIATALYFVGWIYRWQYYNFFQLEITYLDFPAQSFFFVPLQVFFGSIGAILRTMLAVSIAAIFIDLTLWIVESLSNRAIAQTRLVRLTQRRRRSSKNRKTKQPGSWIAKVWLSLARFNIIKFDYLKFILSFVEEIVVVGWILTILYFLARTQGYLDARRDAINDSSTLPVVTLISKEEKTVLGRKLDDLFTNPSLKGYRIFGDKGLFDDVRTTELNDFYDRERPRVWRLLIKQAAWIYLIRTLPADAPPSRRPPVLAIQKTWGDQLMILSPQPVTPNTSKDIPSTPIQPDRTQP